MNEQELLNAAADGSWKEIEYKYLDRSWCVPSTLSEYLYRLHLDRTRLYLWRRKQQPKMIPLGPEDVLVTTQFRHENWHDKKERVNASNINSRGIIMSHSNTLYTWKELMDNWLRTDDSGKTWLPCSKEKADE